METSEAWSATILAAMTEGVVVHDTSGSIVWCNDSARRILGLAGDREASRSTLNPAWRPVHEDGSPFPDDSQPTTVALRTGQPVSGVIMGICKPDGAVNWISINSTPVIRSGTSLSVITTFTDVTRQKAAERTLKEREERFREIAEKIDSVFWIADAGISQMIYVSPAYERVWRRSVASLYAEPRSFLEAVHPDDLEALTAKLRGDELEARQTFETEYRIVWPDGSIRWIRDRGFPICDADGKLLRVVGVADDITDSRRAKEARETLEQQLAHAQKMESVGRLAGGIAHDFNNLLTIINGHSDLALAKLPPGDPLRYHLEEIGKSGDRAAALTRQLLAFSRKQVLQPRVLSLNRTIEEMMGMLRRLVGEHIDVRFALSPENAMVKADPHQLGQVVMNLAVNARDAMPRGGSLLIGTSVVNRDVRDGDSLPPAREGRFAVLTVTDSGVGMDRTTLQRIFEPFFTTKSHGRGTGLGLSMVQGIVEQSGGHISVSSDIGRGTVFKIYLPLLAVENTVSETPRTTANLRGDETILVIEDQAEVREFTAAVLDSYGYRVIEAAGPSEAFASCDREGRPIHLVLTDLVMPEMTGYDLVGRLLKRRPGLKALYMSGHAHGTLDIGALQDGSHFIQKPFTPRDLAGKVREILGPTGKGASPPET